MESSALGAQSLNIISSLPHSKKAVSRDLRLVAADPSIPLHHFNVLRN